MSQKYDKKLKDTISRRISTITEKGTKLLNEADFNERSKNSVNEFMKRLNIPTLSDKSEEELPMKYDESKKKARQRATSRSPGSTQKGGKRRKPRKTKKHRKKKSL